jgi:hypothetical protein
LCLNLLSELALCRLNVRPDDDYTANLLSSAFSTLKRSGILQDILIRANQFQIIDVLLLPLFQAGFLTYSFNPETPSVLAGLVNSQFDVNSLWSRWGTTTQSVLTFRFVVRMMLVLINNDARNHPFAINFLRKIRLTVQFSPNPELEKSFILYNLLLQLPAEPLPESLVKNRYYSFLFPSFSITPHSQC